MYDLVSKRRDRRLCHVPVYVCHCTSVIVRPERLNKVVSAARVAGVGALEIRIKVIKV